MHTMNGLILFSYNLLDKRSNLASFYTHLFHGALPEGYLQRKQPVYEAFGMTDPLTHYTHSIARSLQQENLRVYHGCKHSEPFVESAVKQAIADGCQTIYMLALTPLISKTGTISYEQKVNKYLQQHAPHIEAISLNGYSTDTRFIQLLVQNVADALTYTERKDPKILFTVHSLPGNEKANRDFLQQYEQLVQGIMGHFPHYLIVLRFVALVLLHKNGSVQIF